MVAIINCLSREGAAPGVLWGPRSNEECGEDDHFSLRSSRGEKLQMDHSEYLTWVEGSGPEKHGIRLLFETSQGLKIVADSSEDTQGQPGERRGRGEVGRMERERKRGREEEGEGERKG